MFYHSLYLKVDTPDPYVELYIKTAPNGKKKTKVKNNTGNPYWGEEFQFHLDPNIKNTLGEFASESSVFVFVCLVFLNVNGFGFALRPGKP